MAVPFATIEELTARLDWDLDARELAMAEAALEDASDLARGIGSQSWVDPAHAPRLVRTTVLQACKRYMQNPSGYTQSRAGDETVAWAEIGEQAGAVYFTASEEKLLRGLSGQGSGLYVATTYAWGSKPAPEVVYVPSAGTNEAFPYFAAEDDAAPADGGVYG